MSDETLILTRRDVEQLLDPDACQAAVEGAFRLAAEGRVLTPAVLAVSSRSGGFHVKAAGLELDRLLFAAKTNANFSENPRRFGLPTIQGVIVLADGENGFPLAVMDSIEVTNRRTAAATAVAARYLARRPSKVMTLCGCGEQGRAHARALARVLPLERMQVLDVDRDKAEAFARSFGEELGIEIGVIEGLDRSRSDVLVTTTPAREAFVRREHLAPGTFVAAVGADHPDKQELEVDVLADAKVVVDILDACATMGELHHALVAGRLRREDVHAELAEIVSARKPGRTASDEDGIIVFDSTGTAIEDVAAAAIVYKRAVAQGVGVRMRIGG